MPTRNAQARWEGSLQQGNGKISVASGALEAPYSFSSRFQDGPGTNPEELIGAAHAGCFSMAFSLILAQAGHAPESIETRAAVTIEKQAEGFAITRIDLTTEAKVPGIDEKTFQEKAQAAKKGCPVSKALSDSIEIRLTARRV
ncbi:MAG: OsmC family protein [Desulfobacterales bacterium]|jgi:osmotically inducible protein OsmC